MPDAALLVGAGALAGAEGSAGGITSLVSYPALLAVGIAPLAANVTQAVAFVASWPGSVLGSRPELRGQGPWLRHWALLVATGSAAGVALLLLVPATVFARVVPFLLVLGSLTLLLQPRVSAGLERRPFRAKRLLLPCGLLAVSVYNGYFGAGSGIMTLALLLVAVDRNVPRSNALKNAVLGVADAVTAIGFIAFGPVRWTAAVPLAVGLLAGSRIGPSVTRRVPGNVLRTLVACAGLALAIWLWAN